MASCDMRDGSTYMHLDSHSNFAILFTYFIRYAVSILIIHAALLVLLARPTRTRLVGLGLLTADPRH